MEQSEQKEFYNKQFGWFRDNYDKYEDHYLRTADERIDKVLEVTGIRKGRALELGCGVGFAAIQLQKRSFVADAIDLDRDIIAYAKRLNESQEAAGVTLNLGETLARRYDYDLENHRMLDDMTDKAPGETHRQTLCCYTPEEIVDLAKSLGFEVLDLFPGGRMDYSTMRYHETASLETCMVFTCVLGRGD